ncbi:MAG: hypothetical protein KI786_04785 [Mameliella sp.]|nr:hypothetical protein [Phaeodactylibacter sp.]
MTPPKHAVIDLGTNTFHLLIAQPGLDTPIREVYRERRFIQLAEQGIQTIGEAPFDRALIAIKDYSAILQQHGVPADQVKAFGTAALRTASNGPELVNAILEATGIQVQTISGGEEARLIHKGVQLAVPEVRDRLLIMDIGGGSVEFIIAEQDHVLWAQSFPIGVAVLYREFHHAEPISDVETKQLRTFLREQLSSLLNQLAQYPTTYLVGASGTFDVLEKYIGKRPEKGHSSQLPVTAFPTFYEQITSMNLEERYALPGMPKARAAMLTVALILVDEVIKMANTEDIIISAFAMKEGMLSELFAAH